MIEIRRSNERGQANHGWLQSRHTFSFANYYDPEHMGVSALRVINDDKVIPGRGFGTHGHQDMEIISYVKRGTIAHKDSMGHVEHLPAGEFQLMTAGTGITHSEFNPSTEEPLEFLQIWILPDRRGLEPGYQQKRFDPRNGLQLIASPDARDGSLRLHQDALLLQLRLSAGEEATHVISADRCAYVHVVSGGISVNGTVLSAGDGATIRADDVLEFVGLASEDVINEALLFDLP
ncbi:pirin [Halothiobacillus diazotrophicus]|uniref:Pirin n=2 Tax=Halothiobacillus diazotrophicus TaxID=1860122 RepID=A0A191ZEX8_9GAMM|nr:pirin family protein [Halothiobacillus diazotrophicus]ANJ66415.1 pirin [Halothiobacillus diazotrophicus]